MRIRFSLVHLQLLVVCGAVLAACGDAPRVMPDGGVQVVEDCATKGDEDGNGLADCDDPVCKVLPACQPRCGDGHKDPGEACDDGNNANGDGCEADCTLSSCGNGVLDVGEQCDDHNKVDGDGCEANCTLPVCGNGIIDADKGEECDDHNNVDGDGCEANCKLPTCGNNIVDPGEECDDGNNIDADGCESNCKRAACGNNIMDPGEACDDGNNVDADGCEANCTLPACGNNVLDPGEACDDGNTVDADGCEADCTLPACGNSVLDPGEQCDDGNTTNADGCEANCTTPACGNNVLDPGEACDDGNNVNADGCEANCTLPACGNHILDPGEACDDGNNVNADGCEANCTLPICGNAIVDPGEACDDGNNVNGDGCDVNCTVPACGNAIVDPGEVCDDGNNVNGDGCDVNCTVPACGNSILDPGEQCDDGNLNNADGCDANCTFPACGNGIVDSGEACDDGNQIDGDACETNCTLPVCGNGILDGGEACDDGNTIDGDACEADCKLPVCGNGILDLGEQCDDANNINLDGCNNSCAINASSYVKASNTGAGDQFGFTVAVSADGSTLAVGARFEASAAVGINGNQADNTANSAGAVYLFTRSSTGWVQQAYVKASNTNAADSFGASVALSADGSTLAVGAINEGSAATGINGNQADNTAALSGAVYVFARTGTTWTQQAYVKASNTNLFDQFGASVALAADGSTLAVGATGEASAATGINGNQASNTLTGAGAVYVYARSGTTWAQQAYVKASNTGANDIFGQSVALASDGSTLAVGAKGEASAATGINGNQADNTAAGAGAVYVYARSGTTWTQQAYVKASNTGAADAFGQSVALAGDGATLAVGAINEDSAAVGLNGNQADNTAANAGAAYVYTRTGTAWTQQAYVKASNTGAGDLFGQSIALSSDGTTLAIGAISEDSAATGLNGDQTSNAATDAGAAYVYTRGGTTWTQLAYAKASNTGAADSFGQSISLSSDGGTLAIGAHLEDSAATGIDGDQTSNASSAAGAVYVYR